MNPVRIIQPERSGRGGRSFNILDGIHIPGRMSSSMSRLSRKEKQAQTRSCLMRSAAKLFAQRGFRDASIDDVAEDAGFTKGAFYANFASKEELFLAMLDEHFARRV